LNLQKVTTGVYDDDDDDDDDDYQKLADAAHGFCVGMSYLSSCSSSSPTS